MWFERCTLIFFLQATVTLIAKLLLPTETPDFMSTKHVAFPLMTYKYMCPMFTNSVKVSDVFFKQMECHTTCEFICML